ncbi:MAG: GntR family transcriptional regulator [Ruminococcaceae bacterium]|nr:GntR family transcriptional regulator [Oscillospiraceae bacterium]
MITLNYRDSRPIYEQIKDGIKRLVVTGAVAADEKLPSVRELASSLAINPNTIQRAYRELEQEGYVYTVAGKGSFAGSNHQIDTRRIDELLAAFDKSVAELRFLGISTEELCSRIHDPKEGE